MTKVKPKTHKGTKKVLNIRQSGSITKSKGSVLHNSGKTSTKINRSKREKSGLSSSDLSRLKNII